MLVFGTQDLLQVTLHSSPSDSPASVSGTVDTSKLVSTLCQLKEGFRACSCPSLTKRWHQYSSLPQQFGVFTVGRI